MSSLASRLMAYEADELSDADTIILFQSLVDTGLAWSLQGFYGRQAVKMISAGVVIDTHSVLGKIPS